jgi:hypothetical protein
MEIHMDALSPDHPIRLRPFPLHLDGEVHAIEDNLTWFRVGTAAGELRARRALSCLVWPEVGDRVLTSFGLTDEPFLIAVLARPSSTPLRLVLPGATQVEVADGAGMSLRVDGPLTLGSRTGISMDAPEVGIRTSLLTLVTQRLSMIAREALASLRISRLIGDLIEASAESLNLRLDRSRRTVRDLDQIHAGSLELRAEQVAHIQSDTLLATAQRLVKIDGEQIHLG